MGMNVLEQAKRFRVKNQPSQSFQQASVSRSLTLVQAVTDGLRTMMREDETVLLLGEDIGRNGGVFRATDGLIEEFGEERVIDTPLAESGIIGTSIGLALNGYKPVAEIQFLGFIYPGFEQIVSHAARIRMRTCGRYSVPLVIRAPYGAGIRAPELHSDSTESFFFHVPGLKVVVPSNPYDAKGLLIASIEDPDPVLFLEPMKSYRAQRQDVPADKYTVELGKAKRVREGDDVTVIAWGNMVRPAMEAAEQAAREKDYQADVIDLRTLYPLDYDTIIRSVKKTGRVVIVHEAHRSGGVGAEIIALINDKALLYLRSPIERVTGFDVHVPLFTLEDDYLPSPARIRDAIERVITF
ncbi:2-oxoisovalerate dehydrogenase subunit beta [Caldalkalibacillus thermarum]|uniref:alpha-ketoacid dehydrogenase subunit beta n=1 Tax=Caldalkalibacillus thermarum TaxID=296745 RepID=UPI0019A6E5FD|nr:alpha-ketoacid dehydrogenase subunit beta [Caldalkalibacillus thermarum]GGK31330.1 2-oxoisovalerate dehydrogenase subunit beta [Caldalkalibacillus thermarum]